MYILVKLTKAKYIQISYNKNHIKYKHLYYNKAYRKKNRQLKKFLKITLKIINTKKKNHKYFKITQLFQEKISQQQ